MDLRLQAPSMTALRTFRDASRAARQRADALDRYVGRRAATASWRAHVGYQRAQVNLTRRALAAGVPNQEIYRVMRPGRSTTAEAIALEILSGDAGAWWDLPRLQAEVAAALAPRRGSLGATRRALRRLTKSGEIERHYDPAAHISRFQVPAG